MPLVDNNNKDRLIKLGKEISRGSHRRAHSYAFYNDDANNLNEETFAMIAKRALTEKEIEEKLLETKNGKDSNNEDDDYDLIQIGIDIFERFVLC